MLGTNDRESFRVADFIAYYRRVRLGFSSSSRTRPRRTRSRSRTARSAPGARSCEQRWATTTTSASSRTCGATRIARLSEAGITTLEGLALAQQEASTDSAGDPRADRRPGAHPVRGTPQRRALVRAAPAGGERGLALLPRPSAGRRLLRHRGRPVLGAGARARVPATARVRDDGERASAPSGRTTATRSSARSSSSSTSSRAARALPRPARLPLRALRADARSSGSPASTATREEEVDELLRREVFVDLYTVVRAGAADLAPELLDQEGRDVLHADAHGGRQRAATTRSSLYEQWLETRRRRAPRARSSATTRRTASRRCGCATGCSSGATRPSGVRDGDRVARAAERERPRRRRRRREERERLREALLEGAEAGDERWLAAQLLDYHRREAKPVWWWFFAPARDDAGGAASTDAEAIGGLEPTVEPERGDEVARPHACVPAAAAQARRRRRRRRPGDGQGRRDDRRDRRRARARCGSRAGRAREDVPLPRALIPGGAVRHDAPARGAARLGAVAARRRRPLPALRERPPARAARSAARACSATTLDELKRLVAAARRQLPLHPGAARLGQDVDRRAADRRTCSRTASASASPRPSHKAIHNLLDEIERRGARRRASRSAG